jgi:hypothetical protein
MKAIGLIILAPFILLIMIPLGAAVIGVAAGLFGVIIGLAGAVFGIIVAFFATLFGGLFSIGGLTFGFFFFKLFLVFIAVGVIYLLTAKKSRAK